jgi:uncharacterized delta-60 repeat protein
MIKSSLPALFFLVFSITALEAQQLDASFHSPVALRASYITSVVKLTDGKILVGGELAYHGNKPVNNLIRIATDGTLDATFVSKVPGDFLIDEIELTPSGNIVLLLRTIVNLQYKSAIATLDNSGNLIGQTETMAHCRAIAVMPDGKILYGGLPVIGGIKRLNADLSPDPTFNVTVNNSVLDIQVHDDKIYASGYFDKVNGVTKNDIVKLNFDGSIDESFDTGAGTSDGIGALTILPDGKILPGETFINEFAGTKCWGQIRLNADGSLDPSFAIVYDFHGPLSRVNVIDNLLYVTSFFNLNGVDSNYLVRFNEDGSWDHSFAPIAFKNGASYDVCTLASGDEIIVSGQSKLGNNYGLIKSDHDGNILSEFQPRIGRLGELSYGERSGDKLMVAGDFIRIDSVNTFGMAKLNLDGQVDETFAIENNYGAVKQVRLLPDGKIFVSTYSNFFKIDANGKTVPEFNWDKRPPLYQVVKFDLTSDGKIVVADDNTLSLLNSDGTYDESFTLPRPDISGSFDFDLQGENIIYGFLSDYNPETFASIPAVRRILPDASFDPAFSDKGPEQISSGDFAMVALVKVLNNGEILIGGSFRRYAGAEVKHSLVKLSADGVLDEVFNNNQLAANGPETFFDAAVEEMNDKIYINSNTDLYSLNRDGTVNDFTLPINIERITSIVAIPSDESPNGRTAADEDKLIAIGSFYNQATQSHGSMVRVKVGKAQQPEEPEVVLSVNKELVSIDIFPNPAADRINVNINDVNPAARIDVYGPTGSRISSLNTASNGGQENVLDVSNIPPGVYTVRVVTTSGKVAVSKFIRRP